MERGLNSRVRQANRNCDVTLSPEAVGRERLCDVTITNYRGTQIYDGDFTINLAFSLFTYTTIALLTN